MDSSVVNMAFAPPIFIPPAPGAPPIVPQFVYPPNNAGIPLPPQPANPPVTADVTHTQSYVDLLEKSACMLSTFWLFLLLLLVW